MACIGLADSAGLAIGAMVVAGVEASARAEPARHAVSANAEAERIIVFMVSFP